MADHDQTATGPADADAQSYMRGHMEVREQISTYRLFLNMAKWGSLAIFVLAIFVGYYVVWSVTPALHTPLMAVTNAISSVIIVGGLIAAAAVSGDAAGPSAWIAKGAGVVAVTLASVNIFGGFMVTRRMLAMYKKKERPVAPKAVK